MFVSTSRICWSLLISAVVFAATSVCSAHAAGPLPLHERIDRIIELSTLGPLADRSDDAEFLAPRLPGLERRHSDRRGSPRVFGG